MPIIDLQRRLYEIGRIRIGAQQPTASGKTRPAKLETFRFTSRDQRAIDSVAATHGGTPQEWRAPDGTAQWEVYTHAAELTVTVPPSEMAFSQWYELWSGGGCKRRCDGQHEVIGDQPCCCNPNERECDIHTRLSVILREIPGLGVWRLDSQGWYAATELRGSVEILTATMNAGKMLPARLRLEQRSVTRQGQPRRNFAVPVLDVDVAFDDLQTIATTGIQELSRDPQPALPAPEPTDEPPPPVRSSAPPRTRRAPVLPPTGIRPRTTTEMKTPPLETDVPKSADDVDQPNHITTAQMRKLQALFTRHRITDRGNRLLLTSQLVGRDLDTALDLTIGEASNVIDILERIEPIDGEAFAHCLERITTAATYTLESTEDIDPDTGEIVSIDQPTLNGENT